MTETATMTTRHNIIDFLSAFPARRIWIDRDAKTEESAYDLDAICEPLIDDTGEGVGYHVDQDLICPMLNEIADFLKVDDLGCYLHEDGNDYEFEAFGRGFNLGLTYYDIYGRRQDFGFDSSTVRVTACLEPDWAWDEENEGDPLAMTGNHGAYRFTTTAPA